MNELYFQSNYRMNTPALLNLGGIENWLLGAFVLK
jgi:hypothetical protein